MKYILHSVSYSSTWKGQTELGLDRVIEKAAELGYDGIELMGKRPHASPLDLNADDRKKLKETIVSKGLELPCIAGYHDFSRDLKHPDMPCFEKEILFLRETIRLAYDLGCRVVIVDDVITAGTAIRETVEMLKDFGPPKIEGILIAMNRMEKNNDGVNALAELEETLGCPVRAIVDLDDVIEVLHGKEVDGRVYIDDEQMEKIRAYRAGYGV